MNTPEIHSYAQAKAFLGEKRSQRTIAPNTKVRQVIGGAIVITFYSTDILTYHRNGRCTPYCAGWHTATTVNRMNQFGPKTMRVGRIKGEIHVNGCPLVA